MIDGEMQQAIAVGAAAMGERWILVQKRGQRLIVFHLDRRKGEAKRLDRSVGLEGFDARRKLTPRIDAVLARQHDFGIVLRDVRLDGGVVRVAVARVEFANKAQGVALAGCDHAQQAAGAIAVVLQIGLEHPVAGAGVRRRRSRRYAP